MRAKATEEAVVLEAERIERQKAAAARAPAAYKRVATHDEHLRRGLLFLGGDVHSMNKAMRQTLKSRRHWRLSLLFSHTNGFVNTTLPCHLTRGGIWEILFF